MRILPCLHSYLLGEGQEQDGGRESTTPVARNKICFNQNVHLKIVDVGAEANDTVLHYHRLAAIRKNKLA